MSPLGVAFWCGAQEGRLPMASKKRRKEGKKAGRYLWRRYGDAAMHSLFAAHFLCAFFTFLSRM
jgi:hypothetical protein